LVAASSFAASSRNFASAASPPAQPPGDCKQQGWWAREVSDPWLLGYLQ
jgi:hypothetical protein